MEFRFYNDAVQCQYQKKKKEKRSLSLCSQTTIWNEVVNLLVIPWQEDTQTTLKICPRL